MFFELLSFIIIIGFIIGVILVMIEYFKYKKNPIQLMLNHDKRFEKIESVYTHKFNEIKRGN